MYMYVGHLLHLLHIYILYYKSMYIDIEMEVGVCTLCQTFFQKNTLVAMVPLTTDQLGKLSDTGNAPEVGLSKPMAVK